jgi:hypothetical protein
VLVLRILSKICRFENENRKPLLQMRFRAIHRAYIALI